MRKLIILALLLLLLPVGFDSSIRADEIIPPSDAGLGGDVNPDPPDPEGDHPWGGEERVRKYDDGSIKNRISTSPECELEAFFYCWLPAYYGLYISKPLQNDAYITPENRSSMFESKKARHSVSQRYSAAKER